MVIIITLKTYRIYGDQCRTNRLMKNVPEKISSKKFPKKSFPHWSLLVISIRVSDIKHLSLGKASFQYENL